MRKSYFLFFALAIVLFGCNQFDELENLDRAKYEAEYAIPLVDTKVSLQQILENTGDSTTIIIDQNGLIRLRYQGDVVAKTSDDIFAEINRSLPPLIPILSPRMALPFSSPDGLQIDRLDMKGGSLIYYFENRHPEAITVKATFPQVTKNAVPLTIQQSLPAYSGSGNAPAATNFLVPISLAGYRIQTLNDSVYVEYEAIRASGQKDTLSNFVIRLQDLQFSYAEGYFGNFLYEGTRDTILIDFFDNWIRGDVYFEEPRITLNVENSFGIPTNAVINVLNVVTVKSDVLPLESIYVDNGIEFPYPNMSEIGQVKYGTFSFTKENSNIDVILGAGPVAIDYDVDAITNPNNDPNIRGYITDSSYYKINMEVELPLYGKASGFVARDTFNADFKNYEDVDDAEFKLVVDNAIPLDVEVQAYFLDASNNVIDSLLDAPQRIVGAAPVDAQGEPTGVTRKITFAPFAEARFQKIKTSATRILLNTAFSTLNNGNTSVKIYSSQDVKIKMGVKMGVRN
ncbi:MAG: hypothetical protein SFU99_17520 [Saprospiraceae bacterium]|nr:hypothetical protein [Saprospiraceae bacterium]